MVAWGKRVATVVEIDMNYCNLTFGQGACNAVLGGPTVRKCYNTFPTCAVTDRFSQGVRTYRFCQPTFPIKGGNYIPILESVGGLTQEVNLNGFSDTLLGIGKRATVNFNFVDMPYNDVLTDKYWQERISGAAQINEGGYNPADRGSFWGKFKARNPNFAGRALRHITGYVTESGQFVAEQTREYIIEDIDGPVSGGGVTIVAKDVISLSDNKKAMAPIQSNGRLVNAMDNNTNVIYLTPAGIGNQEYPSSGYVCIGSEVIGYNRSGDTLNIWGRGQRNTQVASHAVNDTVQLCLWFDRTPINEALRVLLGDYGHIPYANLDLAQWAEEHNVWGLRYDLTATITKPEEVIKLVGEICKCFAVSVWPDLNDKKVKMKLNHAILDGPSAVWDDNSNILKGGIQVETNDADRITRVAMNTVQIDPTRGTSADNFLRGTLDIYATGEIPQMFGQSRTEVINNRWINHGDDTFAFILSGRLLARYKRAPSTFTIDIDNKDLPNLVDVVAVESHAVQDITGKQKRTLLQVYSIQEKTQNSSSTIKLQEFLFTDKYARIAPNDTPVYTSASEYTKSRYAFMSRPDGTMSNGDEGYKLA